MNKKILLILLILNIVGIFALGLLCLADSLVQGSAEARQPHLYWKDINVEVVEVRQSLNKRIYEVEVYSKDYNLKHSFVLRGIDYDGYEKGDIIKAELYSWVDDSSGKIIQREIHQIY